MAQGWTIDPAANTITFLEPVLSTDAVVVKEFPAGAFGGTSAWARGAWSLRLGYPSEVEFFSDRLWWSAAQVIWGSQTGDYSNFGKSTPIVDSDAVTFAINSRQVNEVMDLVPLDKMIVMAKGGEFLMRGGQDDVITPSTISIKPQSYLGTDGLQARVAGDTAIFVMEQGQHVYDIGYKFEADGYKPSDLSAWSAHLVEGHRLTGMDWMPAPWNVMWFARSDGKWLGCTYMPAQEVIGWHRHDTGRDAATELGGDDIEQVVSLPGTNQTEVFALVKRMVDGVERRYIEQLAPAFVDDIRDWQYADCAVTYDGRNTSATAITLTGAEWHEDAELTLTASAPLFVGESDKGDGFILRANGEQVRVWIDQFVSATVVKVYAIGTVPAGLRATATADWDFQRDTIGGLGHLEGREVTILTDGSVHPRRTVEAGKVALGYPAGVATVGLPYRAHVETLPLNNPGADTILDAKKLLNSVGLLVQNTRGVQVCAGDLNPDNTYEIAQREFENYADPTKPANGYIEEPVSGQWGQDAGRFHVLSDDPLPMEILSLVTRFMVASKPS